jgi:hypothetical protein
MPPALKMTVKAHKHQYMLDLGKYGTMLLTIEQQIQAKKLGEAKQRDLERQEDIHVSLNGIGSYLDGKYFSGSLFEYNTVTKKARSEL